jgi:hypothetical protein
MERKTRTTTVNDVRNVMKDRYLIHNFEKKITRLLSSRRFVTPLGNVCRLKTHLLFQTFNNIRRANCRLIATSQLLKQEMSMKRNRTH